VLALVFITGMLLWDKMNIPLRIVYWFMFSIEAIAHYPIFKANLTYVLGI